MTWRIESKNRKSPGVKNAKGVTVDPPEWSDVNLVPSSLLEAVETCVALIDVKGAIRIRAYAPGGVDPAIDVTKHTLPELRQALVKMRRNAA